MLSFDSELFKEESQSNLADISRLFFPFRIDEPRAKACTLPIFKQAREAFTINFMLAHRQESQTFSRSL